MSMFLFLIHSFPALMLANMVCICNSVMFMFYTQFLSNYMFLQVVSFLTTWRSPLHTHWPATSQRFHPSSSSSLPVFLFLWELSPSSASTWALTWSTCLSTPFFQFFFQASSLKMAILMIEDISFKLRGFSSLYHCCRFLDFTMLFLMSHPLLYSEHVLCLGPHCPWGAHFVWGGAFSTYCMCKLYISYVDCGRWMSAVRRWRGHLEILLRTCLVGMGGPGHIYMRLLG